MRIRLFPVVIGLIMVTACGRPAPPENSSAATPAPAAGMAVTDPMEAFGTTASNVFFYYADVERATAFYRDVLGLRVVADYGFAKILQVAPKSFLTLVDASEGMHDAAEPKTTAIALVTDQLDEWWEYLSTQNIEMRSSGFDPEPGRPHHGFVAIDPEGYFLEFERFNEHPENDRLLPVLDRTQTVFANHETSGVPEGLGFKATIVWFYYRDLAAIQRFYEDVLGFDMIVDQGWTKIYQVGPTGYFGLVDESRGMHNFTEEKGVTMSFITANIDGWFEYFDARGDIEQRHDAVQEGDRYREFVIYDPEGYYLEFDVFKGAPENAALLEIIAAP